jgi:integrase
MARSPRVPAYRRHSSGQARVTLNGKDHLLGPYNSAASHEAYRRLVAEWLEQPDNLQPPRTKGQEKLLVKELILAYWKHAVDYYGFAHANRGDEACLRSALRVLRHLYGNTIASQFGPLALKACRGQMVDQGWSRTYVNAQIDRIRRMFRWAAGEELLEASVYQNLRAVAGLRAGKCKARETQKVKPVPPEHIDAASPFMPAPVKAMVQFQLLTGCRPAEVCLLRPMDINRSDSACWVYRPGSDEGNYGTHKTAHHGRERMIFIGPKAQKVLRPYLDIDLAAYCFSPAESEVKRNAARRALRKTPLWPSHRRRRVAGTRRRRAPRNRYDSHSYRRAVARACRAADRQAHEANPALPADKVVVPTWSPNRLRHNRATALRPFGLDLTKTILGHTKVETSEIYAEKDLQSAMALVAQIG